MQRSDSRNSLSMYTSQRDTMSNLFTQQQHSFQSKENTGRIGYFGPKQPAEQDAADSKPMGGKSEGGMDFGYGNKGGNISLGRFNSLSSNQNNEPPGGE